MPKFNLLRSYTVVESHEVEAKTEEVMTGIMTVVTMVRYSILWRIVMGYKLPTEGHKGKTYSIAFDIWFEIDGCKDPEGDTITPQQFREAILHRVASMKDWELKAGEAVNQCGGEAVEEGC